jgi:hypothetical protein
MLIDKLKVKGTVLLTLTDEFGNVKHKNECNLVVDTGLAYIASRMVGTAENVMSHMAVGTNNTAAAGTDTALGAESGRVALDSTTIVTTTVTNDSVQYVATFPPGTATAALVEAALLNAGTSGTLLSRVVFGTINKGASDTLSITWTLQVQ